jgi:hypothetical protein
MPYYTTTQSLKKVRRPCQLQWKKIVSMWFALKSFEQSEEKSPKIISNTFNSPMSET